MEFDKNIGADIGDYPLIKTGFIEKIAKVVSVLSSPPLLAIAGIVLVAATLNQSVAQIWAAAFIALSIIPPLLYVLWLVHTGKVSNFHLDIRNQRRRPLLVILANAAFVWGILLAGGAPGLLVAIAAAGMIIVALILLITTIWKISGHSASAGGIAAMTCMIFGQDAIYATAIVPVVAWSRIQLGRHTFAQTVAGAVLGGAIFALALYVAGI